MCNVISLTYTNSHSSLSEAQTYQLSVLRKDIRLNPTGEIFCEM